MRVVVDTNVVLDLLLDRRPWSDAAAELFSLIERGILEGYLSATTVTTIHYLTRKAAGTERARREIGRLLALCPVAPVDHAVLESALRLEFNDYEDAVIHEAARQSGATAIVTRNTRDFRGAELAVLTPAECVGQVDR